MEYIAASTFYGLLVALLLQGGLLGYVMRFFRREWGCWYPMALMLLASILTLHAILDLRSLIPWIVATALLGNFLIPLKVIRSSYHLLKNRMVLTTAILAGFFVFYAAYPVFRSDQWTYHLVVAKMLAQSGTLQPPIFNDHIYFTGVYEYLGVLGRAVKLSDIAMQSFADSFTALSFLIGMTGVLHFAGVQRQDWAPTKKMIDAKTVALLLAVFCLFAMPTPDMIYNFKSDGLTVIFSALALVLTSAAFRNGSKTWALLAGFYLGAGLGLKFTWIHLAIPFALVASALFLVRKRYQLLAFWAVGGIVGLAVLLPVFAKNIHFFDNPLHPAQFGPFRTTHFSETMMKYWENNNQPLQGLTGYPRALFDTLVHWFMLMLPFFSLPFITLFYKPKIGREQRSNIIFGISILVGYLCLWPFLFRADIFPRFIYASVGLLVFVMFEGCCRVNSVRPLFFALLAAVAINGGIEVKVAQLAKGLLMNADEFYAAFPPPMNERNDYIILNKHRRAQFPDAAADEQNLLSDNNSAYFFDARLAFLSGYDFAFYRDHFSVEAAGRTTVCVGSLMSMLKIRYLYSWRMPFQDWPEWLQPMISMSIPIPGSEKIRVLPVGTLSSLIERELPDCQLRRQSFITDF